MMGLVRRMRDICRKNARLKVTISKVLAVRDGRRLERWGPLCFFFFFCHVLDGSIRHGKSIEKQRCTRHVFFWLGCAYWKVLEAGSSLINFFVDRSLYNESPDGKIVITTVLTRSWRYSTFLPAYFWNHFSLLCISWCQGVLQ